MVTILLESYISLAVLGLLWLMCLGFARSGGVGAMEGELGPPAHFLRLLPAGPLGFWPLCWQAPPLWLACRPGMEGP